MFQLFLCLIVSRSSGSESVRVNRFSTSSTSMNVDADADPEIHTNCSRILLQDEIEGTSRVCLFEEKKGKTSTGRKTTARTQRRGATESQTRRTS